MDVVPYHVGERLSSSRSIGHAQQRLICEPDAFGFCRGSSASATPFVLPCAAWLAVSPTPSPTRHGNSAASYRLHP
jgi:hypothetical protein